jgi:hypothetical protein
MDTAESCDIVPPEAVVASTEGPETGSSLGKHSPHTHSIETLDFSVIARARAAADALHSACTLLETWIPSGDKPGTGTGKLKTWALHP